MKGLMVRFVREDAGQDLIEYALLATVIALVVFVGASTGRNLAEHLVCQHQRDDRQLGGARSQAVKGGQSHRVERSPSGATGADGG